MKRIVAFLFVSASILGSVSVAHAQHAMDDNELMTKLKAAAPAHVLEHATIMNMGADASGTEI
jgi:hypothetical protein